MAVFDSGVGGLTVLRSIRKVIPDVVLDYVMDLKNYPYGPKDEDDVIAYVLDGVSRLVNRRDLSALVIACNTASTLALPALREKFSFPIIGVVPAIKPAARLSKSKSIALIATPGTVTRPYTQMLIEEFASDCKIIKIGSTKMVDLAEAKLRQEPVECNVLEAELAPLLKAVEDIDAIVLGCTHFPLLREEILEVSKTSAILLDSGDAVARQVAFQLSHNAREVNSATDEICFVTQEMGDSGLMRSLREFGDFSFEIL